MQIKNARTSTATIVAPTGVPKSIEPSIPTREQITAIRAEQTVTDLKLLNRRIAESAGKIISAEISKEPTRFMARTITTAINTEIIRLYSLTFVPDAKAKFSSKVTLKILL